jgi:hypothetical protein
MTGKAGAAEYLEAYVGVRERLGDVIGAKDGETRVGACPGWRVRDVVAHLAGLCEDWVTGQLDGYASEEWTANQVLRNANLTCEEILRKWAQTTDAFAALGDDPVMGRPPARWAFGDAITHEADIRGALAAGRVPDDAVLLGLDGSLQRWSEHLSLAGSPTLHLRTPDNHNWWVGPTDRADTVVCDTSTYEVFRALTGRRNAEQVRTWVWSDDPEPFIVAGLPYPFHWATNAISD